MRGEAGSIADLIRLVATRLATVSDSPQLDAELLLSQVLGRPRSYLYTWPERQPDAEQNARFHELLARRLIGEPIAYLTGRREFWSLELEVSPDTLIPRPETELLVEQALQRLPPDTPCRVADLGTGSGAIALALAHERPRAHIVATDASVAALTVAERNARRLALDNIEFRPGDWCTALPRTAFDLIVSNPPYVAADSACLHQGDLRFEPRSALTDDGDGLGALRRIIRQAPDHLAANGWLLLEHGHDQGTAVADLLHAAGFREVAGRRDAAGLDRISAGRRSLGQRSLGRRSLGRRNTA